MFCDFITTQIDNKHYKQECKRCGGIFTSFVPKYYKECKMGDGPNEIVSMPEAPSKVARIKNFLKETIAGKIELYPTASQKQIDDRATICKVCPLFIRTNPENLDVGICGHMGCGCQIDLTTKKFFNKLAHIDQDCPLNKWAEVDAKYRGQASEDKTSENGGNIQENGAGD